MNISHGASADHCRCDHCADHPEQRDDVYGTVRQLLGNDDGLATGKYQRERARRAGAQAGKVREQQCESSERRRKAREP